MKETSINFLKGEFAMNEMCSIAKKQRDVGIVHNMLNAGKSEVEVYEEFEARYNRRKNNPHWNDEAPDVVFSQILEIIKAAEKRLKEMK